MSAPASPEPLERRRDRTEHALSALTRLLEAARKRSGLDALAVAENAGLLVAGSGPAVLCDELAAYAPLARGSAANDQVPSRLDVIERRAMVQRLAIDGIEIVVCGAGGGPAAEGELSAVAAGCRRILGEATSPARR